MEAEKPHTRVPYSPVDPRNHHANRIRLFGMWATPHDPLENAKRDLLLRGEGDAGGEG
jgi:hypothetical protein